MKCGMELIFWIIDVHGCSSVANIDFVPICSRKNCPRIWRHNMVPSSFGCIIYQLRHSRKSLANGLTHDQKILFLRKVTDYCLDLFSKCNGCTVDVLKWISYFNAGFILGAANYPCCHIRWTVSDQLKKLARKIDLYCSNLILCEYHIVIAEIFRKNMILFLLC